MNDRSAELVSIQAKMRDSSERLLLSISGENIENYFAPGYVTPSCYQEQSCYASLETFKIVGRLDQHTSALSGLGQESLTAKLNGWIENGRDSYRINLSIENDGLYTHVNHRLREIHINLRNIESHYNTRDTREQRYSFPRLIIHELLHAMYRDLKAYEVTESQVILETNALLKSLGYYAPARGEHEFEGHNHLEAEHFSFIQAAPPPKPGESFYRFFNRPVKEFVSDPWMWLTAFLSVPNPAGIGIPKIIRTTPRYQPLAPRPPRPTLNRTPSSVSGISTSTAASEVSSSSIETISSSSSSIETLSSSGDSIEVLSDGSDSSSIETLPDSDSSSSVEVLSEDSDTSTETLKAEQSDGEYSFEDDTQPLSEAERISFAEKVDDAIDELSPERYPLQVKMRMIRELSPTAHYINQAPNITRRFMFGEISVVELYESLVPDYTTVLGE